MQQPAKSQIITLRDWADVATALIRRFMQLRLEDATDDPATIQALIDQWTIEDSVRWVGTLLDDEFNNQMRWSASSDLAFTGLLLEMKTKYAQYLPDVLDEERSNKRQRREFLEDLICELDPITIVVGEFVASVVSPNPWWVWSLHLRGDVVLVESDEDYRIKIFNEKVETGEWSVR